MFINNKIEEKLPEGFRDIFPVEAEERNVIKNIIKEEFDLWGYGEIKTPVVEFTKNIAIGVGKNWKDKLISFFDSDGNLVSLRTDMTIPIARFTGMRIKKNQLPVKFYYFANSFRQSNRQKGLKREYNQAGLEFIGSDSYMCDVEVLIIIINILNKIVSNNFLIGLGDVNLSEALYDWLNLNKDDKEFIKSNLILKNYVAIREYLYKFNKNKAEIFLNLIKPIKDITKLEKILKDINDEKVINSFSNLKIIYGILNELDFNKYFIFDLGILRDFEYYTGLIFEIYSSNINSILGSGGRYNKLIKKFGLDAPATGFALDIDMLHKSIKESNISFFKPKLKVLIFCDNDSEENNLNLLKFANKLRKLGINTEILYEKNKNIFFIAKENKFNFVGIINDNFEKIEITNLDNNKIINLNLNDSLNYFKNEGFN